MQSPSFYYIRNDLAFQETIQKTYPMGERMYHPLNSSRKLLISTLILYKIVLDEQKNALLASFIGGDPAVFTDRFTPIFLLSRLLPLNNNYK